MITDPVIINWNQKEIKVQLQPWFEKIKSGEGLGFNENMDSNRMVIEQETSKVKIRIELSQVIFRLEEEGIYISGLGGKVLIHEIL